MSTPMTPRTENDALIEALNEAQLAEQLEPGRFYAFKHSDRVSTIDLLERNLTQPRRKTGTVHVKDVPSFVHYYDKHSDDQSEVYVDIDTATVTAVLNAHMKTNDIDDPDDTARWCDHRLILTLAKTEAWKRWTGLDRQLIKQAEFAEFIDDNRADIRTPAAAEMLELVQQFQAIQRVTFQSAAILSNGDRRLTYQEETEAGAGAKGSIEVPSTLELGIAPFDDSDPYAVTARFRYRIQGGALFMGFLLDNADDVAKDAVKTVVAKLSQELGITVMRGTPA